MAIKEVMEFINNKECEYFGSITNNWRPAQFKRYAKLETICNSIKISKKVWFNNEYFYFVPDGYVVHRIKLSRLFMEYIVRYLDWIGRHDK